MKIIERVYFTAYIFSRISAQSEKWPGSTKFLPYLGILEFPVAAVRTSKPHCSSRVFYPLPSSHHLLFLLKPGTQRGLYSSSHQSADQANGCSPVHTLKWCAITRSPPEHFHMGSLTHSKALLGSFPSSWKQVCQMGRESLHAPPWFIDTYGWPDQGAGPRTVQADVYVSSRKFVFNGNCGCTSLTVQWLQGKEDDCQEEDSAEMNELVT